MKRDSKGNIYYYHTNKFEWFEHVGGPVINVKGEKLEFGNITYKTTILALYEICNVYTDKGSHVECFKLIGDTFFPLAFNDGKRAPSEHMKVIKHNIQEECHPGYNCHGFTFLDGGFWLNPEWVKKILNDDNYEECKFSDLGEGGVVIYNNKENLEIHSGTVLNGSFNSKLGLGRSHSKSEEEMDLKFPEASKKFYVKKSSK